MNIMDGVFTVAILLLFAGILALSVERRNGHINNATPEPTLLRQLEACGHQLATAQQSAEVWRALADKRKTLVEELSAELEKCNDG